MIRRIHIELLKLVTVRLGLRPAGVGGRAHRLFSTVEASRAGAGNPVAPLNTSSGLNSVITGGVWGLILATVLGVTMSSGEFRHPTATLTYLATPGRSAGTGSQDVASAAAGAVSASSST